MHVAINLIFLLVLYAIKYGRHNKSWAQLKKYRGEKIILKKNAAFFLYDIIIQ